MTQNVPYFIVNNETNKLAYLELPNDTDTLSLPSHLEPYSCLSDACARLAWLAEDGDNAKGYHKLAVLAIEGFGFGT